jgi:hypothetical protein
MTSTGWCDGARFAAAPDCLEFWGIMKRSKGAAGLRLLFLKQRLRTLFNLGILKMP